MVKNLSPLEEDEQMNFVAYLRWKQVRFFAIVNEQKLLGQIKTPKMKAIFLAVLKRMGYSKGVPDIFIPLPAYKYAGLFIEMKRISGGVVSPEQKEWLAYLEKKGYKSVVCCGNRQAIKTFEDYINGRN